jgi:DNA-binding LacI/PurR family transcriptional regulator
LKFIITKNSRYFRHRFIDEPRSGKGYLRALREYHIQENSEWIISGEFKENFGYQMASKFLQYSGVNLPLFLPAIILLLLDNRAAREMGIEIPGDLL